MARFNDTAEIATDLHAQQRPPAGPAPRLHRLAPSFIRVAAGVHPDHGLPVTFTPGEAIPGWLAEALAAGRGVAGADGVIEVQP